LKSEILQLKCGYSADRCFVPGSWIMKKLLGIMVLGLLKSYPIDYGTTFCGIFFQIYINL